MHMSDALLSPVVGGVMTVVSLGALVHAGRMSERASRALDRGVDASAPLMGVMGAFVFAAQMINITIPGTGASGHIGGGVLLAAVLGPYRALLVLAAVLLMQCLFFADGGLLAYGCNVFNMGVFACWLAYFLVYRPIINRGLTKKNIIIASVAAAVLGLQAGSFGVVLETTLSGVAGLPFGLFTLLMQPIHLAIGILEGLITAAILCFIHSVRPALLSPAPTDEADGAYKRVALGLLVAALLIGGGLSIFASGNPDGLEWSVEKTAGETWEGAGSETHNLAENIVETTALMPDYTTPGLDIPSGAGIIGSILVAVVAGGLGLLLRRRSRKPEPVEPV